MNRYPLWKYLVIAVAMMSGLIYTLPNFFGESPAVPGFADTRHDPGRWGFDEAGR